MVSRPLEWIVPETPEDEKIEGMRYCNSKKVMAYKNQIA
jgi:hypothetical protein